MIKLFHLYYYQYMIELFSLIKYFNPSQMLDSKWSFQHKRRSLFTNETSDLFVTNLTDMSRSQKPGENPRVLITESDVDSRDNIWCQILVTELTLKPDIVCLMDSKNLSSITKRFVYYFLYSAVFVPVKIINLIESAVSFQYWLNFIFL